MRAPRNEATGTAGQSEVKAEFETLGWGVATGPEHDTGTDLWVYPRDERRHELLVMMGVQVKTGPSFKKNPAKDADGNVIGWWFQDRDWDHFDYWISHVVPHIIVLRDQNHHKSYWAHIQKTTVQSTGNGAKILIPADQTIDETHQNDLINVALTTLPKPTWNGTLWGGAEDLSEREQPRHALIAPRIIAPHPNNRPEQISGLQALALRTQCRPEIIRTLLSTAPAQIQEIPLWWPGLTLSQAQISEDWGWRATAVLHQWLTTGDRTQIEELIQSSPDPRERAAAVVMACVAAFGDSNPDAALTYTNDALKADNYSPVDHAWLSVQKARALLEIGELDQARSIAFSCQQASHKHPSDVTAAAISGAAARIAYRSLGWGQGDIQTLIQASDNPASWWRAQQLSYGLGEHLDEDYREWSRDGSIRVGAIPEADRHLLGSALVASNAGDQTGWCTGINELARHILTSPLEEQSKESLSMALTLLRVSGDNSGVSLAVERVHWSLSQAAVRDAAAQVNPRLSTQTTASADLEMLIAAGDVNDPQHATQICEWAIATLNDPKSYMSRTVPQFNISHKLVKLLQALIWTLEQDKTTKIIEFVLSQENVPDNLYSQDLADLVKAIPDTWWSDDQRQQAADLANSQPPSLREALLQASAVVAKASKEQIHSRLLAGDLQVISAVADFRSLKEDEIAAINRACGTAITQKIEEAQHGYHSYGGINPGQVQTLVNVVHSSQAQWQPVLNFLSSPGSTTSEIEPILQILLDYSESIASDLKTQLQEPILALRDRQPGREFLLRDPDIRGLAAEVYVALSTPAEKEITVLNLFARGDRASRESAVNIVSTMPTSILATAIMLAASDDPDEATRSAALRGLCNAVIKKDSPPEVLRKLLSALKQGTSLASVTIASELCRQRSPQTPPELLEELNQNMAGHVRYESQNLRANIQPPVS
ncbi:MAG: DUF4365 domain-containing protein [Propionibacteriaceae bacterium]